MRLEASDWPNWISGAINNFFLTRIFLTKPPNSCVIIFPSFIIYTNVFVSLQNIENISIYLFFWYNCDSMTGKNIKAYFFVPQLS